MRVIVYGAGAVGGVVAGPLGQDRVRVAVNARGDHAAAIEASGLVVESPDERVVLKLPVATAPAGIDWRAGDVVLMGMKSQDAGPALVALRDAAGPDVPVVCLQNGVENERAAL